MSSQVPRTLPRNCTECNTHFMVVASAVNRKGLGGYTCSKSCRYKRLSRISEIENKNMKMTKRSVHAWIKRVAVSEQRCKICNRCDDKTFYDWSNISGEYKRDVSDWQRLCRQCHTDFDIKYQGRMQKWKNAMQFVVRKPRTLNPRDTKGRFVKI